MELHNLINNSTIFHLGYLLKRFFNVSFNDQGVCPTMSKLRLQGHFANEEIRDSFIRGWLRVEAFRDLDELRFSTLEYLPNIRNHSTSQAHRATRWLAT